MLNWELLDPLLVGNCRQDQGLGWASKVGVLHCQVKWFWQRADKEKAAVVIESYLA